MDQGILTMVTVGVILVIVALALWLLYTVIWRAVRRGMQEFDVTRRAMASRGPALVVPDYPPSEWFEAVTERRAPRRAPRRHR